LMGSYVDQSLTRNESVISRAQTSWIPTIIPVIIGILLLPFYGLGLLIIIPVLLRVWSTELALTNQRVIAKVGLIRRNTVELRIDKVESLGIHQGILGRIFNYGSIVIKGTGGTNTPIPNIKAPMQFRSIVNNHIEEMNSKQQ
ncbi:PH domain-containing protein, partial [Klebsiella pneumoniae]